MKELRSLSRELFRETLRRCTVDAAFSRHLHIKNGVLQVAGVDYELDRFARVLTIAIGKAAHTMAAALRERIGPYAAGIIAAPYPVERTPGFRAFVGGHPLPDRESLAAGDAILQELAPLDEHSLAIFLLSGGGSALAEAPLTELTLEDIVSTYRVLVHSGASIREINAMRKHLSALKGGRMALAASPARQLSLLISDVPADGLDALASGPTLPDPTSTADCYSIADRYAIAQQFPLAVRSLFLQRTLRETPKPGASAFARSQWITLMSSEDATAIAAQLATASGFTSVIDNSCDDWDYLDARDYLLARLQRLRRDERSICLISGGEVTVRVPAQPGIGGRNQQFALACAEAIDGEEIAVLSCGTDGIDGNSPAAGAVVDGTTLQRAGVHAVRSSLQEFDAYSLFARLGDAIEIGPTGNNVRDLRMLFAR